MIAERIVELVKKLAVEGDKEDTEIQIEAIGRQSIGKLSALLKLSDELIKIGKSTYKDMDLTNITPFDDVNVIKEFSQKKKLPPFL